MIRGGGGRDCGERISKSWVSEAWVCDVSPEYLAFKGDPENFSGYTYLNSRGRLG